MSDVIRESVSTFHAALQFANQALQSSAKQVEDRKQMILSLLRTELQIPQGPVGDGVYQAACRQTLEEIRCHTTRWLYALEQMVARSEFVNRHEKSILVIAFADVKSGKSSLGNFVSGYYFQDTPYQDLYQPLTYTVEDFSKASTEDRFSRQRPMPFHEDEIEATSTIQYYTLHQGLTWVDTPGLHSLTLDHGALANEYVQFADLVLFLTSSSSPLKEDEREELGKLLKQDKPVMVVITKSDTASKTVKNGKFIHVLHAKSPEKRKIQETYVMDEIQKLENGVIENRNAVSISTKLACRALQTEDGALFHASNLDTFLAQMGEILSQKAVELKMRRPVTEMNHCIDQLIGTIDPTDGHTTIQQERERLRQSGAQLEKICQERENHISRLCSDMASLIPTQLSLQLRDLRTRGMLNQSEEVKQAVTDCLSTVCTRQCIRYFEHQFEMNHITLANRPVLKAMDLSAAKYEKTIVKQIHVSPKERPPKGLIENIQKWVNENKKFYKMESTQESIVVGDNFTHYVQELWQAVCPQMEQYVAMTIDALYGQYITPLLECYQQVEHQLASLEKKLTQLKLKEGSSSDG